MSTTDSWGHRWFGFWREQGAVFEDCPRLHEWTQPDWTDAASIAGVARYLAGAPVVYANGPVRCLLCAQQIGSCLTCQTDGSWYWASTLAHYVTDHGIRLPTGLQARIVEAQFIPPGRLWANNVRSYVRALKRLDVPMSEEAAIRAFIDRRELS